MIDPGRFNSAHPRRSTNWPISASEKKPIVSGDACRENQFEGVSCPNLNQVITWKSGEKVETHKGRRRLTSVQWIASPPLLTATASSSRRLGSKVKLTVLVVAADQSSGHLTFTRFLNTLNSRSMYWRGGRVWRSGLRRERQ